MNKILPIVFSVLILCRASASWAAGEFIRAFYPDDQPVLIDVVNPQTLAVPVPNAVAVSALSSVNVGGQILAAPVLTTTAGVKLVHVNDGHLYHHPAYPDSILWWNPHSGRWRIQDSSSPTGWRYLRHEWDLDPPE